MIVSVFSWLVATAVMFGPGLTIAYVWRRRRRWHRDFRRRVCAYGHRAGWRA